MDDKITKGGTCLWMFFLCLLLGVPSLLAQDVGVRSSGEEGASWRYDFLQLLLEERNFKVERSIDAVLNNPDKSVIILGNDGYNVITLRSRSILQFIEQGGAIVLMHELAGQQRADVASLVGLGNFYKGPVSAIIEDDAYETFYDCVRVTNISDREGIFNGVKTLVTNRAGWFKPSESSDWDWETVATFPAATLPSNVATKRLLCVGRPLNSSGMAIVLADSSILTNNMLWHGDNGLLALRLSELFQKQGRDRFVMVRNNVVNGSVTQKLAEKLRDEQARMQPPNMPKPKPTLEQMLQIGNIVAKEVIDSNVLNEALQRQPRHMPTERYFRLLIFLLVAAATLWILWKTLTSRSLREFWLSRRRQRFAYEINSGNEAGDYRTAACYLAQEFCIQWTGSPHSRQWQQSLATLLVRWPSVTPADRQELTRIVDIASRGHHERMLAHDFQKFGKTLDTLRKLFITSAPA